MAKIYDYYVHFSYGGLRTYDNFFLFTLVKESLVEIIGRRDRILLTTKTDMFNYSCKSCVCRYIYSQTRTPLPDCIYSDNDCITIYGMFGLFR